jgi:hypothetical protein
MELYQGSTGMGRSVNSVVILLPIVAKLLNMQEIHNAYQVLLVLL